MQQCDDVDARLAILDELLQAPSVPEPVQAADTPAVEGPSVTPEARQDPAARWQQLSPLTDAALGETLNHRFEQWRRAKDQAHQARRAQREEKSQDDQRAARHEASATLAATLDRAEAALADGRLAETSKLLVEIDELTHRGRICAAQRLAALGRRPRA